MSACQGLGLLISGRRVRSCKLPEPAREQIVTIVKILCSFINEVFLTLGVRICEGHG